MTAMSGGRAIPVAGDDARAAGFRVHPGVLALACAVLLAAAARPAPAQAPRDGGSPAGVRSGLTAGGDRPTVGLALSGGTARGLAHVGVLRGLEDAGIPVDVVAGTSMGAVVGGLYAAGHDAGGLRRIALEVDWDGIFREAEERVPAWPRSPAEGERYLAGFPIRGGRPSLPTGLVTGQRVTQLLTRLTWRVHPVRVFASLPRPFVALATDLETGDPVVLDGGFLPEAIRASLAIPSIFTPELVDGRYLIDGAFSRNLPAEDARRLGADVLLCSDVSRPLQPADSLGTFLDVLTQTLSFREVASTREQLARCDVVLRPDDTGLGTFDFGRAETWIERGEAAARAALPEIRERLAEAADSGRAAPGAPERAAALRQVAAGAGPDSVYLDAIRVEGLPPGQAAHVGGIFRVDAPGWTALDRIDRAVGRLFDSGWFARVDYRLARTVSSSTSTGADSGGRGRREERPSGRAPPEGVHRTLVLRPSEEARNRLRAGLRYESHFKASMLLTADLHNVAHFGSTTRLDLRLGEQVRMEVVHRARPSFAPAFVTGASVGYLRVPLDLFEGSDLAAEAAADVVRARGFAGRLFGSAGTAGLEARVEWFEVDDAGELAPAGPRSDAYHSLAAVVAWDSYGRVAFPRRGLRARLRSEWSDAALGSGVTFSRQRFEVGGHVPLGARVVAFGGSAVGASGGGPVPLHRRFFLGGATPSFVLAENMLALEGLRSQRLRGRHLQRVEAGIQVELVPNVFVAGRWNAGATPDRWVVRPAEWIHGFGLTLGARTALGPAALTLSDATSSGGLRLELDLGGRF